MSGIDGLGALQKTLLAALDQMGAAIMAELQANPDMVFLHQSPGISVDPKDFEDPWTPEGGDVYALMASGGTIKIPQVPLTPPVVPGAGAATPSNKPQPLPPPDPTAQLGINSAVNTSHLANQNLLLGSNIASYGLGSVADAWGLVAPSTTADHPPPTPPDVLAAIKKATDILYVHPGVPTPGYRVFRTARNTVIGLIGAKNAGFVAAMGDPAAAAAWPFSAGKVFDQQIQDAETDRDAADLAGGDLSYSDAEAFINAQGKDMVSAAVDATHMRWETFGQASGAVGQFAYTSVDPVSWCQSTDDSFGAMQIDVSDATYQAASSTNFSAFSKSYFQASRSSDSGGVGIVFGPFGEGADASFSSASQKGGFSTGSNGGATGWDQSSSASMSGEFFLASIDRPWLYDEILRISSGWHVKNQPSNFLSDGTNTAANNKNWLPVLPVQMLVARNVTITCDNWGHFSTFASHFASSAESQNEQSAKKFSGSIGAFGLGGSYNHQDASTDGSQFNADSGGSSWSFQSNQSGGTVSIHGTQILGWVARILPASPPA